MYDSHSKSAQYENPRNSSCIACERTSDVVSIGFQETKIALLTRLNRRKHRCHARKLLVEITRIGRTGDLRNEWGRDPLMVNILPIDVAEERLRHDFLGIGRSGTETQLGLAGEQFLENRDRIAWHVNGVERFVGKNGVVDIFLIFATEWRYLRR